MYSKDHAEFDNDAGELVLTDLFPGISVDDIISNMAFKPRVKETLSILEPITRDELQFLNRLGLSGVRYS